MGGTAPLDDFLVSKQALRTLGARGIVRPAQNVIQALPGLQAEIVAGEIQDGYFTDGS
jgi:phosphotransferase system IIB component